MTSPNDQRVTVESVFASNDCRKWNDCISQAIRECLFREPTFKDYTNVSKKLLSNKFLTYKLYIYEIYVGYVKVVNNQLKFFKCEG